MTDKNDLLNATLSEAPLDLPPAQNGLAHITGGGDGARTGGDETQTAIDVPALVVDVVGTSNDKGGGAKLWPAWMDGLGGKVGAQHQQLFTRFAQWMAHFYPAVWCGHAQFALAREPHKLARAEMVAECQFRPADMELLADWWDTLISAGNRLRQWMIPLLPNLVHLPRPKPAFVRSDMQLLRSYREVEAAFGRLLLGEHTPEQVPWMVLASSIMNGAVTWRKMLSAIASLTPECVSGVGDGLEVRLELRKFNSPVRVQLWFPEKITSALLARWLFASPNGGFRRLMAAGAADERLTSSIQKMFKALDLPPMKADDFLRAAKVSSSMQVSGYAVAYLSGELASQSLPAHIYHRANGWVTNAEPEAKSTVPKIRLNPAKIAFRLQSQFDPMAKSELQIQIIADIRSILRGKDKEAAESKNMSVPKKIYQRLNKSGASVWPITKLIGMWLVWRLGEPLIPGDETSKIKAIMASTSYNYLGSISQALITVFWQYEVSQFDAEAFEELYEAAGELCEEDSQRPVFWMCARSFHNFLTLFNDIPEISFEDLDGFTTNQDRPVTANIVHEREYHAFLGELLKNGTPAWDTVQAMILVVTILGFRCGMRRREIHMLQLKDIHPGAYPMLLVRASMLATLKTLSAKRRIPLWSVMPEFELQILMGYWEYRRAHIHLADALVFSYLQTPTIPMLQSLLFDPITQAFQAILEYRTPAFRFHHLRHSFANWMLLAMFALFFPGIARSPSILVRFSLLQEERLVSQIRLSFFPGSLEDKHAVTRKILHQLGTLMGHLSPLTTLKHYVHILDWLVAQEVDYALQCRMQEEAAAWGPQVLEHVCRLRNGTAFSATYASVRANPLAFLGKFVRQQVPYPQKHVVLAMRCAPEELRSANLDDILLKIPPPILPSIVDVMVTIAQAIDRDALVARNATSVTAHLEVLERPVEWLTQGQSRISPRAAHELFRSYKKLFVGSKEQPDVSQGAIPIPVPDYPKNPVQKRQMMFIVHETIKAFNLEKNRPAMIATAKCWLQRDIAQIKEICSEIDALNASQIVNGLGSMGIDPKYLSLRYVSNASGGSPGFFISPEEVQELTKKGIQLDVESESISSVGSGQSNFVLVLTESEFNSNKLIDGKMKSESKTKYLASKHFIDGCVDGLNYASLWINCVLNIWSPAPVKKLQFEDEVNNFE